MKFDNVFPHTGKSRDPIYTLKEFSAGVDTPYSTLCRWMKKTANPPVAQMKSKNGKYYLGTDLAEWYKSQKSPN